LEERRLSFFRRRADSLGHLPELALAAKPQQDISQVEVNEFWSHARQNNASKVYGNSYQNPDSLCNVAFEVIC
jgi:hypothetical protein